MKLSTCIHQFFDQYLPRIKGVSENTIKNYRITFTLFLPFAAQYYSIKIKSLGVEHLSQVVILAFLDYLEIQRLNIAKTRNNRLVAIKSLFRMIRLMYPEKRDLVQRILDIPQKKIQKQLIGFLYPEEIFRVLEAVDLKRKKGLETIPCSIYFTIQVSGLVRLQISILIISIQNIKRWQF